jgi:abortive infection bacteriophage resistance protein
MGKTYDKKALTLDEQADLLLARGLLANRAVLIERLRTVNYYRLSGYLYPFRQLDDTYISGTTFDAIWRRYNFDRRLRMLLLDAIERLEIAVRSRVVHHFVMAHGPFGYLRQKNLPGFKKRSLFRRMTKVLKHWSRLERAKPPEFTFWIRKLKNEKARARNEFVIHFETKYGGAHKFLPLWMAAELMTCETTQMLARAIEPNLLRNAANDFGFPDQQLLSWTKAIFTLRNSCAHHARVWNRVVGVKPSIPGKNKNPLWHVAPGFAPDRVGILLTVCNHWLQKVNPASNWKTRLFALFDEYPDIPVAEMGLPAAWRSHPLWL